jgi:hypothetical protein
VPGTALVHSPIRVHTTFHLLVCELQDAMQKVFTMDTGCPEFGDAYAALNQRRKELYEWVAQQTERPSLLYAVFLKF